MKKIGQGGFGRVYKAQRISDGRKFCVERNQVWQWLRLQECDKPLLILISGTTGTGKSTLLNALFEQEVFLTDIEKPTTKAVDRKELPEQNCIVIDSHGLHDDDNASKGVSSEKQLLQDLKREMPDVIIYCVSQALQSTYLVNQHLKDLQLIRKAVGPKIPLIIMLTQIDQRHKPRNEYRNDESNSQRNCWEILRQSPFRRIEHWTLLPERIRKQFQLWQRQKNAFLFIHKGWKQITLQIVPEPQS